MEGGGIGCGCFFFEIAKKDVHLQKYYRPKIDMKCLRFILTAILLSVSCAVVAQPPHKPHALSEGAFASLLTVGPGDDFYETFGHTALRICDTANDVDVVFNYGSFYFDQKHFYLKFAKGRLNYFVDPQPFENFLLEYGYYGRAVWEQRLLLDSVELESLYKSLLINAQPENKYYAYDFFRDNCATRVRDMVEQSLRGRKLLSNTFPAEPNTYRSLIYKYTDSTLLWWRLGLDLLLGCHCDEVMTTPQYMYVPMEMMTQYDTTRLATGQTLTESEVQLLPERRTPRAKSVSPTLCFWIAFGVVALLTLVARLRRWKLYWLDALLFAACGIVSLLLMYLWFCSDHYCCNWNLNLLWANPIALWMLCRLRRPNYIAALLAALLELAFVVAAPFLPQAFNSATIPMALMLLLRYVDRLVRKN